MRKVPYRDTGQSAYLRQTKVKDGPFAGVVYLSYVKGAGILSLERPTIVALLGLAPNSTETVLTGKDGRPYAQLRQPGDSVAYSAGTYAVWAGSHSGEDWLCTLELPDWLPDPNFLGRTVPVASIPPKTWDDRVGCTVYDIGAAYGLMGEGYQLHLCECAGSEIPLQPSQGYDLLIRLSGNAWLHSAAAKSANSPLLLSECVMIEVSHGEQDAFSLTVTGNEPLRFLSITRR